MRFLSWGQQGPQVQSQHPVSALTIVYAIGNVTCGAVISFMSAGRIANDRSRNRPGRQWDSGAGGVGESRHAAQRILAANPKDSFARYGLRHAILRYGRNGSGQRVGAIFHPSARSPELHAGLCMAAQTLGEGRPHPPAKEHLEQGIASARREGNAHAQREMQALLDGWNWTAERRAMQPVLWTTTGRGKRPNNTAPRTCDRRL